MVKNAKKWSTPPTETAADHFFTIILPFFR
jgi:hypothetical protein